MTDASSRPIQILIVDDDREIRDLLSQFLQKHGYQTDAVADGQAMHCQLAQAAYDLIVLDLMLPKEDGLTLCRQLRTSSIIPIIMLTAIGEDMDRIVGLEMGADDYVTKPFNPRELLARIKAVLRRHDYAQAAIQSPALNAATVPSNDPTVATRLAPAPCFQFSDWVLDLGKRELRHQVATHDRPPTAPSDSSAPVVPPVGTLVSLTAGEFDLLLAFVKHPQRVLSRDQLLDFTKGHGAMNFDRSIDVQLSRLRRKIEVNPKDPKLIKTVRGGGYLFTPTVTQR